MKSKASLHMNSSLSLSLSLLVVLLFSHQAFAQFTFTTIDFPGADTTEAHGINGTGQIVGEYWSGGTRHGFLLSGGSFTAIDAPPLTFPNGSTSASSTVAFGINNTGVIVGYDGFSGYFLSGGTFTRFSAPGASPAPATSTTLTIGRGINGTSQAVGDYYTLSIASWHGFLYSGGSFTTIEFSFGASTTQASGINDSGQIAGSYLTGARHAFLYSGGSFTTIDFPGASATNGGGINNPGQIVGNYADSGGTTHGFLLSGATFTTIDVPGANLTFAEGINDAGQIVGEYSTDSGATRHGYLATPVPPDTTPPLLSNVQVSPDPVAINNSATLTANLDDSTTGGSNVASAEYNIDGGTFIPMSAVAAPFDSVSENVTASVAPFTVAGLHTVCVRGRDVAGNVSAPECTLLVVYDPTGGFVTGGGAVNSPVGADLLNTSAAGRATFGFVSKYLPGRSTPDGNLEFQFKAGSLNFKSTSMDWLVVTGEPRGVFRGTGTINGANVCKFEVDAWDGSFQPGNVDAFGLKIFSCASGGDRYSLSATALTQGSVIIHK